MLYKVFISQWKYPLKGDWTLEVQNDLVELGLDLDLEQIKNKSKNSFKRLVKVKVKEYTFNYLMKVKETHTKMEKLKYKELKTQNYLKDTEITVAEAKNLFRYRTRVARYKENMKSSYLVTACPVCCVQIDTQEHSIQ